MKGIAKPDSNHTLTEVLLFPRPPAASVFTRLRTFPRRLHADAIFRWLVWSAAPFEVTDEPALVVAPHQDDETFGCGGLIALKRARGVPVRIVFLTDGARAPRSGGELVDGDKDRGRDRERDREREAFVARRKREAIRAAEILGVNETEVIFLDYPDASLAGLSSADRLGLQEHLRELMEEFGPGEIFVTHRADRHRDHEAAFAAVASAVAVAGVDARVIQYSIWMSWSAPLFLLLRPRHLAGAKVLGIGTVLEKKRRAIAAHASQLATLPHGFLNRFLQPFEVFFQTGNSAGANPPEPKLALT